MCMGGGGNRATITVPDYRAYDQQFELQRDAVMSQINNNNKLLQGEVNQSLAGITEVKQKIADYKVAQAEETDKLEEQAQRLSVLMGNPPPEKTASAPDIGVRERGVNTRKGKQSLRIGRKVARKSGQGTGLNIT